MEPFSYQHPDNNKYPRVRSEWRRTAGPARPLAGWLGCPMPILTTLLQPSSLFNEQPSTTLTAAAVVSPVVSLMTFSSASKRRRLFENRRFSSEVRKSWTVWFALSKKRYSTRLNENETNKNCIEIIMQMSWSELKVTQLFWVVGFLQRVLCRKPHCSLSF